MSYIIKQFHKLIGKTPIDMPMVQYWKTKEAVAAKIINDEKLGIIMKLEGEKYPFPTFPRGHLLLGNNGEYSQLSKLKHQIKNQIFNESWDELEKGKNKEEIIKNIKRKLKRDVFEYFKPLEYDMLPPSKMTPSVREIFLTWTKIGANLKIRDYLCFILQEDDAYRFRVQWLAEWFGWFGWLIKLFPIFFLKKALTMLEHGEVINDMKERQKLLKRILLLVLEDESVKKQFITLVRRLDWRKIKLSKGDKYHFRGKYFKVDYKLFDY